MPKVIGFDNIQVDPGNGYALITGTYAGLNWTNMFADDPTIGRTRGAPGYQNGIVSGTQEAFSARSSTAHISVDGSFTFKSVYLTSPFGRDNVDIHGYKDGVELYHVTVDVLRSKPTLAALNFVGVDDVSFTSGSGLQIVFDDVTVGNIKHEASNVPLHTLFEANGDDFGDRSFMPNLHTLREATLPLSHDLV